MSEELKHCPCCGAEAYLAEVDDGFRVYCLCGVRTDVFKTMGRATAVWNARPIENKKDAEIARLRDALDTIVGLFEINGGFWAVAEKMHETAKQALEKGKEE